MEKVNGSLKLTTKIAISILAVMFILMLGSVWNDSAIMDELAHIPAGFGYVMQWDYRLNPEHPPLLKALSALSGQIFARPHFPTDTKYWQEDVNGQWAQGATFLYESGNNADKIIFWSRFPLILLAIIFGWIIFLWAKNKFGNMVALLALLLYAFSPTFLTHARYVTTDLGAAFAFFIGLVSFVKFLEVPSRKNLILAGIFFGVAQLIKFSLVLLIPVYALLLISWIFTQPNLHWHDRWRMGFHLVLKTALLGLIGFVLVWIVYTPFLLNYPQKKQLTDAELLLSSYGFRPAVNLNLKLIKNDFTRPLGQYMLGVLMVNQRAAGGNTAFFLDEVSSTGSRLYFPLLYILKEPLPLHILTLIALLFAFWKIRTKLSFFPPKLSLVREWIQNHFTEFSALVFILFYWAISIQSPLNIGVRHILPTFPFIYVLVAKQITEWLKWHELSNPQSWLGWLRNIYQIYIKSIPKYLFVGFLMIWLVLGTVTIYPNFMPYYNELARGPRNGSNIAVDSNYDWGQDLIRLADFVEKNRIKKIAVDYFGGGSPRYYLGDKFEPWWSARGYPSELTAGPSLRSGQTPAGVWFAISATFKQGAFGKTAPGFIRKPEDSYEWLKPYAPVAQIGYSIFVYKLP